MSENNQTPQETELQEYVSSLEERIVSLEARLAGLEEETKKHARDMSFLKSYPPLPDTKLLSDKFLTRAFTVLGHYFVASIIIAIPAYCVVFLILTLLGD